MAPRRTLRLAIGTPVYQRAWSLPLWFEALETQELPPGTELSFHFGCSPSTDGTEKLLLDWTVGHYCHMVRCADLPSFAERSGGQRFAVLGEVRNRVLDSVERAGADYFLSVDTDILLRPGAVRAMLACAQERDAGVVGALLDMTGVWPVMVPSAMELVGNGNGSLKGRRWRHDELPTEPRRVGVTMAAQLLSRRAWELGHYDFHSQGEDIAFAISLERAGVSRWIEPRAQARHLYQEPCSTGP